MPLNIAVVYGSVREQRQGVKGARFVAKQLEMRGHQVVFVDAKEYNLPLLDRRYSDYEAGKAPEALQRLAGIFTEADAFVLVTGEYNHGIPPALKNLLDYFMGPYSFKPSAIASYSGGPFGGVRAAIQLREVAAELKMPAIPTNFAMSAVHSSFDEESNAVDASYNDGVKRFLDELEWYAYALKAARGKGVPY